jgi:hypothetical protein
VKAKFYKNEKFRKYFEIKLLLQDITDGLVPLSTDREVSSNTDSFLMAGFVTRKWRKLGFAQAALLRLLNRVYKYMGIQAG